MNKNIKILLIGDSITQSSMQVKDNLGWGCYLNDYYSSKADIIVRAKKAHTTSSILPYIYQIFDCNSEHYINNVDVVILTLGSNDATDHNIKKWGQYTSLEDYEKNINIMIDLFLSNNVKQILLVTPPQMHTESWNKYTAKKYNFEPNIKTRELTKQYADKIKYIINNRKENNLYLIDLWDKTWGYTAFTDGLHLSKEGNKLFFNNLKSVLDSISEINPKNLPDNIPDVQF